MTTPRKTVRIKPPDAPAIPMEWDLRLYVAGPTPKSIAAFHNLEELCEKHLPGRYRIEVIDLAKNPQLAQGDQILAVPTLVRKLPSGISVSISAWCRPPRTLCSA